MKIKKSSKNEENVGKLKKSGKMKKK